jgi:uncharacterized repeat protein (TIGR04138 family)
MEEVKFDDALESVLRKDPRYRREAYVFLREALDYTQKVVTKNGREAVRHISGQELLGGIRAYALEQFGPMTLAVLHDWGLRACEDFGELVFNLVDAHVLSKTESDSRADFKGGYDFEEAFRKPFQPAAPSPESVPASQNR